MTRRISAVAVCCSRASHVRMGLRECSVLLLQFREQPHVLDGDHGLVGERLVRSAICLSVKGIGPPCATIDG